MIDFTSPDPPPPLSDPLSTAEVAALFSVSHTTVVRWDMQGLLTSTRTAGGHRRFAWADVRAMGLDARSKASRNVPSGEVASAWLTFGPQHFALLFTPELNPGTREGSITLTLGYSRKGKPVELTVTSLAWLEDLEDTIRRGHATGVVQAGMTTAVQS